MDFDEEEGSGKPAFLTPGDVLRTARDYWALAIILAAPLAFAFYYVRQQEEPVFSSAAVILFEVQSEQVVNIQEVIDPSLAGLGGTELGMANYLVHLKSRSFVQEVIDSLSQEERGRIVAPYVTIEEPEPSLAGIILSNYGARILGAGTTVRIESTHRDPEMAAFLANRITERFTVFITRRAARANEAAIKFLMTEADELRQQVKESDLVLQQYRERHNMVSLEENQNLVASRLSGANAVVSEAHLSLIQARSVWMEAEKALGESIEAVQIPAILGYPGVREAIERVNALEGEREVLGMRYGARHPRMIEAAEVLAISRQQQDRLVKEALVALQGQYEAAQQRYDRLSEELVRLERASHELDRLGIEYNVLRRRYESQKATYDRIISRLNETVVASKLVQSPIRIVDYASVPNFPTSPNQQQNMLGGIAILGVVFAGVIGLVAVLDRRVRSGPVIEEQLHRELIGEIPLARRLTHAQRALIMRQDVDPALRELFLNLCGKIQLTGSGRGSKTLLVTSCLPEEGKSFVAVNLAFGFRSQGMRVLLIDGDLRAPTLGELINHADVPGLHEWAVHERGTDRSFETLETMLIPLQEGVDLLPAGEATENPSAIMAPDVFDELLGHLRRSYDMIVIDAPPAMLFHDAVGLANVVDETLVVSRYLKVSMSRLKALFVTLDKTKSRKIGVIFNGVPRTSVQSGYYGKAQEYYSKKRGDAKKDKKKRERSKRPSRKQPEEAPVGMGHES